MRAKVSWSRGALNNNYCNTKSKFGKGDLHKWITPSCTWLHSRSSSSLKKYVYEADSVLLHWLYDLRWYKLSAVLLISTSFILVHFWVLRYCGLTKILVSATKRKKRWSLDRWKREIVYLFLTPPSFSSLHLTVVFMPYIMHIRRYSKSLIKIYQDWLEYRLKSVIIWRMSCFET